MAATYANQLSIVIGDRLRNKEHPYCLMNNEALERACRELKTGLKLWLYLAHHQDEYEFGLSQKACESWGIKKDTYYRSRDELIEKKYLVEIGPSRYRFDEIPVEVQTVPTYKDF